MIQKLQIEPFKIFTGTEGDFYEAEHELQIGENLHLRFSYFDFHRKKLHLLGQQFDAILAADIEIKESGNFKCHTAHFGKPIYQFVKGVDEKQFIVLVAFDEQQPGIFWLGIESVWEIL